MKKRSPRITRINTNDSLKQKAAKILQAMGYEVEYDRSFAGCKIEVFIKKKYPISSDYESWVCSFDKDNRKVRKEDIDGLYQVRQMVKQELAKESNLYDDCQAMFISAKGFTRGAIAAARKCRITLTTLDNLRKNKEEFIKEQEKLSRELDDLLIASVDIDRWDTTPSSALLLAHLFFWGILREIVENHKEWESWEVDTWERRAVDIIKLAGKQKW